MRDDAPCISNARVCDRTEVHGDQAFKDAHQFGAKVSYISSSFILARRFSVMSFTIRLARNGWNNTIASLVGFYIVLETESPLE